MVPFMGEKAIVELYLVVHPQQLVFSYLSYMTSNQKVTLVTMSQR
jgi:hypothetical protein